MKRIEARFGKEAPLTVTQGPIHEYLGMTIDFSRPGTVQFHMKAFIYDLIAETPSEFALTTWTTRPVHVQFE